MDVSRALADLEEVRIRLAATQRFRGLSAGAAIASGVAALGCGAVQAFAAPHPTALDVPRYVAIWTACLAFALAVNYGAVLAWVARRRARGSHVALRTVGMSILPSIFAGGIVTIALLERNEAGLLPGVWCLCYALGLFASRTMVAPGVVAVAAAFGVIGASLVLAPGTNALAWWVMPASFGFGQLAIGALVWRDEIRAAREGR